MSNLRRLGRWTRHALSRNGGDAVGVPSDGAPRSRPVDERRRRRVQRLRSATLELSSSVTGRQLKRVPSTKKVSSYAKRARLQRERATFVKALASGSTWGEALLATSRGLLAGGRPSELVALALRLETSGVTDDEVPVVMALAADHQNHPRLVASELRRTTPATIAAHAATAAVRAGVLTHDDDLITAVLDHLSLVSTDDLVTVACTLRSARRPALADRAVTELGRRWDEVPPSGKQVRVQEWLFPSTGADEAVREPIAAVLSCFGPFGATPDSGGKPPSCLGTVASLALVMHAIADVPSISSGDASGGTPTTDPLAGAVRLIPRDFSSWPPVSGPLWTIATGRFPTSPLRIRPEFPFAPSLEPLFLGFSLVGSSELEETAVDYLRSMEPIGCSDRATVRILRKAHVKAFYSGRVESTLSLTMATVSRIGPETASGVGPAEHESLRRTLREVRRMPARSGVVTTPSVGRLVLARSLGHEVKLQGGKQGHARLDGSVHRREGLAPEAELARRMLESVTEAMRRIAAGEPPADVRAAWARFWASDVEADIDHPQQPSAGTAPNDAVLETAARIRSAGRTYGPQESAPDVVHVSLATDHNLLDQLPVTIEAIVRNTSRPLRMTILTRGVGVDVEEELADAHPTVGFSFFPCDGVDHGGRLIKHITASTMDRLLLPEILGSVSRTVYIDIDALVLDDVGRLFDWDLAGAPVAARISEHFVQNVAVHVSASLEPDLAGELRDIVLQRASHRAHGLNAGVLVLDLDRMRKDDFCRTFVPWVSRYRLNDQDVMEFYAGDELVILPERWNSWPYREVIDDPAVVHWVGPFKPWRRTITRQQQHWAHYARLAAERRRPSAASPRTPSD